MAQDKKQIFKPKPISGFPEWLPEERLVELQWLDHIRKTFESYGYCSIETPAVEALQALTAKGETDKEIYVLQRLQAQEGEEKDAKYGLHFDQTVPMARYVAQHFNELIFPFKRYAMQKVWRGERPQLGRMREFYQCDIDVIHVDHLPLHFDAEIPATIYEALMGLNIGDIRIRISNRKILLGLLDALGIQDTIPVTRTVDKLDKLGRDEVAKLLDMEAGIKGKQADTILDLVETADIGTLNAQNAQMEEGLDELDFVLTNLAHLPDGAAVPDLSIVRGLDYYTGTVYETRLLDVPQFTSSICSGGRYDDLAGSFINKHLPGVGISIGFTRLFDVLRQTGLVEAKAKSPSHILVALMDEESRATTYETAKKLRSRGYNVESYHAGQKLAKQINYAEKKGIPYIWFPATEGDTSDRVKRLSDGHQVDAKAEDWVME